MTVNGLIVVYLLMNFADSSEIRRLSGAFIYYLVGESKELAKYVFEKNRKKLTL